MIAGEDQSGSQSSGDSLAKIAALLTPLAAGLFYPKLARHLGMFGPKRAEKMDSMGILGRNRSSIKELLRETPSLRDNPIQIDMNNTPLEIMRHNIMKSYDESPHAFHDMHFGVTPPGVRKPMPLASLSFTTSPRDESLNVVDWLGINPAFRMSSEEFRNKQQAVLDFLKAYGVNNLDASPISDSRMRLFKNKDVNLSRYVDPQDR